MPNYFACFTVRAIHLVGWSVANSSLPECTDFQPAALDWIVTAFRCLQGRPATRTRSAGSPLSRTLLASAAARRAPKSQVAAKGKSGPRWGQVVALVRLSGKKTYYQKRHAESL
jgi:hypothetical protein